MGVFAIPGYDSRHDHCLLYARRMWWHGWMWGFIAALGGVAGCLVGYWIVV